MELEKPVYIYTLSSPNDLNNIKYVGKANDLYHRMASHITPCNIKTNTPKNAWIKSLLRNGERPVCELVDIVPHKEWQFWERYWISQFKAWGFNLKNINLGGEGNNSPRTEAFKEHLRKTTKGRKSYVRTPEILERVSVAAKKRHKDYPESYNKTIEKLQIAAQESNKKRLKPVTQLSFDGKVIDQFIGVNEAARKINASAGNITAACKGKLKTAYGFKWKYTLLKEW